MNCDCGQPATRRDGSGNFCQTCADVVKQAQAMIDEHIRKQRQDALAPDREDRDAEYWKDYRQIKIFDRDVGGSVTVLENRAIEGVNTEQGQPVLICQ